MLELQNITIRMKNEERTLVEDFSLILGRGTGPYSSGKRATESPPF